jgi:hypothetical protein
MGPSSLRCLRSSCCRLTAHTIVRRVAAVENIADFFFLLGQQRLDVRGFLGVEPTAGREQQLGVRHAHVELDAGLDHGGVLGAARTQHVQVLVPGVPTLGFVLAVVLVPHAGLREAQQHGRVLADVRAGHNGHALEG